MARLLRRLALLAPPLRRLHADRGRLIDEVARLNAQIVRLTGAMTELVGERDRLARALEDSRRGLRAGPESGATAAKSGTVREGQAKLAAAADSETPLEVRSRRLYVAGYARTGTTVLMDVLNSSPDVFLFSELQLHVLRRVPDAFDGIVGAGFLERYLERKRQQHPIYKSSALPLPGGESATIQTGPDDYLDRLGRSYRYVGDKITIAHTPVGGLDQVELLDGFLRAESQAIAVLTIRRPSETLVSYAKMFPDADLRDAGLSIARANVMLVRRFLETNRSSLVFHEDIGPGLVGEFQDLLETRHNISPKLVDVSFQKSRRAVEYPALLRDWVTALDRSYEHLYGIWKCDPTILKRSRTAALVRDVDGALRAIEALVRKPPTP